MAEERVSLACESILVCQSGREADWSVLYRSTAKHRVLFGTSVVNGAFSYISPHRDRAKSNAAVVGIDMVRTAYNKTNEPASVVANGITVAVRDPSPGG